MQKVEIKWAKEDNICVFIMIKDKKLFFKVNDGEYKNAFDLTKEEYWIYFEKNMKEENDIQINSNNNTNNDLTVEDHSSKIIFIYARKI